MIRVYVVRKLPVSGTCDFMFPSTGTFKEQCQICECIEDEDRVQAIGSFGAFRGASSSTEREDFRPFGSRYGRTIETNSIGGLPYGCDEYWKWRLQVMAPNKEED